MSEGIRTFTVAVGKLYNGKRLCRTPKVVLSDKQDIAVNCIDFLKQIYQVQLGPNDLTPVLTFLVTCDECDTCGTKTVVKKLCTDVGDCGELEICNNGFCESTFAAE